MTSGRAEATTCRQNEWLSGVRRVLCHGSGRPAAPGKTCSSGPTSETSAVGTPSWRRTRRTKRSNASSDSVGRSAEVDGLTGASPRSRRTIDCAPPIRAQEGVVRRTRRLRWRDDGGRPAVALRGRIPATGPAPAEDAAPLRYASARGRWVLAATVL